MAVKISGKNVDIGQALRSRIQSTISRAAQKYFDGGYSGHVTVSRDGRAFRTDCALHLDTGAVFEASGDDGDAQVSFDLAAERLEKRLRRDKRRRKQHKGRSAVAAVPSEPASEPAPTAAAEATEEGAPAIVAEGLEPPPLMSVAAAARSLELAESPLMCFRNANHGGLNVVYRRSDGHIGWIDPALNLGGHA